MIVALKFHVSFVVPKRLKRAATNLVVDRPFLFFLLHRDTQLVLLAGKVQNPTQVP
jgi:serine protease inhibitor